MEKKMTNLKIEVFHSKNLRESTYWTADQIAAHFESDYEHVGDIPWDTGLNVQDNLHRAYDITQSLATFWKEGVRSSCTGDVFKVADAYFIIRSVGFSQLELVN